LGSGRVSLPQQGIVVSVFPNDRKLHALRRLADRADFARFITKLDPAVDPAATSLEVLSYKPERRLVARVSTGGLQWAVLRVYTEEAFATAFANARAFRSTPRLRVARRLGKSYWQQMLAVEYLAGRSLDEHIRETSEGDVPGIMTAVALALADLHAQSDARLRDADPTAAADRIAELARWVGFVCPGLAERAERLAQKLRAGLLTAAPTADVGATHGDFYASQVLLGDGTAATAEAVAVLDFDEAARGETVTDVANFIAHLEADAIRGHVPPARVAPHAIGLTEAYRRATGRPLSPRLNLHVASGLFRLLPHPFRRREQRWPELTRQILRRAEEALESA
jgi:aminoglycoside phosphotransferase (APT) family kinase protein